MFVHHILLFLFLGTADTELIRCKFMPCHSKFVQPSKNKVRAEGKYFRSIIGGPTRRIFRSDSEQACPILLPPVLLPGLLLRPGHPPGHLGVRLLLLPPPPGALLPDPLRLPGLPALLQEGLGEVLADLVVALPVAAQVALELLRLEPPR